MTAVAMATKQQAVPVDLEREILARIDRAGLHICEAELRHKLRWDERTHGSLLELLAELEATGLIESAIHFRLTDQGRAELPEGYDPPMRYGTGIPWRVRS
jgi:DNA-binding PadR family transcriptional regulator